MMAKPKGFRLDKSAETVVVVCRDCGWRGLVISRATTSAWRQAASHERRAHPGHQAAANGLWAATTRRAG